MSTDGGTGAPATGEADQQPGNISPIDNGAPDSRNGTNTPDTSAWDTIAQEFGDPDEVRKKLGHARTWQTRAQQNYDTAQQVPTLQQQIEKLQQDLTQRDERDTTRAERSALAELRGALGERGVKWDDIDEMLRPDPKRLLKDGDPDDAAITKFATALAKNAGRATPDPDQGQRGGDAPTDMNAMIRRAAGRA